MAENKANTKFIVIVLVLIVVGIIGYTKLKGQDKLEVSDSVEISQPADNSQEVSPFLIEALKDRILGDPNAPIKISEHSSLTCSHCAHFHKETFKQLKEKYLDTGKAYLVFSDFPLNGPAVHASMIARCIPEDKYFDYIQSLFVSQEKWAFDGNYISHLKQSSEKFGLNGEDFNACIKNKNLQKGILEKIKAAQSQWKVSATPTFVINNRTVISGARPFKEFSKIIDEELAKTSSKSRKESVEPPSKEELNLNE